MNAAVPLRLHPSSPRIHAPRTPRSAHTRRRMARPPRTRLHAATRAHGAHASQARRAAAPATAALSRRRCDLPRGDRASAGRRRGRRPARHRHRSCARTRTPSSRHLAPTKWYKSNGKLATQRIDIRVGAGAKLDWLPQNNIVFESSNVELAFTLTLDDDATAIGWDAMQLGRQSSGERWSDGRLAAVSRIRTSDGRLRWFERAHLTADDPLRDAPQGLACSPPTARSGPSALLATTPSPNRSPPHLPFDDTLRAAASCVSSGRADRARRQPLDGAAATRTHRLLDAVASAGPWRRCEAFASLDDLI